MPHLLFISTVFQPSKSNAKERLEGYLVQVISSLDLKKLNIKNTKL